MIVTTGKSIRVEVGKFLFHCSCDTPGLVTVTGRWNREEEEISLPSNEKEAEEFIAAYRRAIREDIPYREREVEAAPKPALVVSITGDSSGPSR